MEKMKKAQKGAVDEPAGARDAEVDAGLAALDEQSRELHAIALEMCNGVAQKTVRLHEHARRWKRRRRRLLSTCAARRFDEILKVSVKCSDTEHRRRRNHRRGRAGRPADGGVCSRLTS